MNVPASKPRTGHNLLLPATSALGALLLGMAAASFGYGMFGASDDAGLVDPPIWPPRWMFWSIWFVLYPAIGIAGAHLWRVRGTIDGRPAWRLFCASFVTGLAWVPIVQASGSRLVMPVVMDLVGLTIGVLAYRMARRASATAALWLLPSLSWGIATTILKLWRLSLNTG